MKKITGLLFYLSFAFTLTRCATPAKLVQTELYFGLSQKNGMVVSDSAWQAFVNKEVSKIFWSGFTTIRSEGKWLDQLHNRLHAEPSGIIIAVGVMTTGRSKSIDSLREKYKAVFLQESVLRIDKNVSASF